MISSLELTNYRGFERYRLSGLARVNLLVGRNNSGKTSILEAVNLLDVADDPRILNRIAFDRGEVSSVWDDKGRGEDFTNVFHLFHGHEPKLGESLAISSDGRGIRLLLDDPNNGLGATDFAISYRNPGPRSKLIAPASQIRFALDIKSHPSTGERLFWFVTEGGSLVEGPIPGFRRAPWRRNAVSQFINAGSLGVESMREMWDTVNLEGNPADVISAMQILEPSLDGLFFLTSEKSARDDAKGGILVAVDGRSRRVPLGSYGEGMRRLLALSLALACARGSILLVDEIDTGLHYSIMGDLWQLVVEMARRYDVQVFATTHSLDCIRGLAWLCEHHPELGQDVSLQKIETVLEEAVAFDARSIRIAAEQDIEVR